MKRTSVLDEVSSVKPTTTPEPRFLAAPVASVISMPLRPDGLMESVTMWNTVAAALGPGKRPSPVSEVLLPRTLPVTTMDDLAPYHLVQANGTITLRKGAAPKAVAAAAAEFADGKVTLDGFLDRIGVPKA